MRRSAVVAATAVATMLSGATFAIAKPPQPTPLEAGSTDALVYVYRAARWNMGARTAVLWVDGLQSNKLPNGACTVLRLPAGTHRLQVDWTQFLFGGADTHTPGVWVPAELEAGKSYWFRFETRDGPMQGAYETIEWELFQVDEARGVTDTKRCSPVQPAAQYNALRSPG